MADWIIYNFKIFTTVLILLNLYIIYFSYEEEFTL